jgi:hypothetical protein
MGFDVKEHAIFKAFYLDIKTGKKYQLKFAMLDLQDHSQLMMNAFEYAAGWPSRDDTILLRGVKYIEIIEFIDIVQ